MNSSLASPITKLRMFSILAWMILVMFIFLLLFSPPEFWQFYQALGLDVMLRPIQTWLALFFTAGYQG